MWHMRDRSIVLAIFVRGLCAGPSSHKHDRRTVVHQLRNSFEFYNLFEDEREKKKLHSDIFPAARSGSVRLLFDFYLFIWN